MSKISFVPPAAVAREAARGLKLRASLPPSRRCCTKVGIARAAQLKNRRPVSLKTVKRMKAYFDRHQGDRKGRGWGVDSKGWQAWLLWGGDPGRKWAEKRLRMSANPGVPTHLDVDALSESDRKLLEELDPAFEFDETLRKQQIAERIVAAGPRPFKAPTAAGWVFVHPDLKHPGSWRATFFDENWEPYSHIEFPRDSSEESFADTVKEITLDAKFDRMEWYVGNPGRIDPALYDY